MYKDFLSPTSYGRFNKKLAAIIGLPAAVYLDTLSEIFSRAIEKNKIDEDGFFTLNRKYVEQETSLSKSDQLSCDEILLKLNLIDRLDSNTEKIVLNNDGIMALFNVDDVSSLKLETKKATKAGKTEGKRIGITNRLKNYIREIETNEELLLLYDNWIDATYDKGMCQSAKVKAFRDAIEEKLDTVDKKKIALNYSIAKGYVLAEWSINYVLKGSSHQTSNSPIRLAPQQTATTATISSESF